VSRGSIGQAEWSHRPFNTHRYMMHMLGRGQWVRQGSMRSDARASGEYATKGLVGERIHVLTPVSVIRGLPHLLHQGEVLSLRDYHNKCLQMD